MLRPLVPAAEGAGVAVVVSRALDLSGRLTIRIFAPPPHPANALRSRFRPPRHASCLPMTQALQQALPRLCGQSHQPGKKEMRPMGTSKQFTLGVAAALLACGVAGAAENRGNPNQKGTLLMFPKIVVDTARGVDTLVDLTNAGDRDATVTCYWIDGTEPSAITPGTCFGGLHDGQSCSGKADCAAANGYPAGICRPAWAHPDFHLALTKRQPSYFRASTGLPGPGGHGVSPFPADPGKGALTCWASDDLGGQVNYNFLKGDVVITDAGNGTSWEYAAWGFRCKKAATKVGDPCGVGSIQIGTEFDYCPNTLELDFFASNDKSGQSLPLGGPLDTDVAVISCDQLLTQEGTPVPTKMKYDIWNENETKFTGLTRCMACFDHAKLSAVGGAFRRSILHTEKGLARIDGVDDDAKCCPKELDSNGNQVTVDCSDADPLVGVAVKEIDRSGKIDRAGSAIHGAGMEEASIFFDRNASSEEGR
jgi:hypothetical protein